MSDEKLVAFDVHETIGVTPVNPAGSILEAIGPIITHCLTGDQRCSNCAYHNSDTDYCTVRSRVMEEPTTTVCMQWAEKNKQPVFGGTSLSELEEKQRSNDLEYANRRKALDEGAKQGMTLEALDTVFAIACQQVPSMTDRWQELKAELTIMLTHNWAKGEMPK